MHALPTPGKLFTPAVIALCLLLTACFGSDPPPTRESNRTPTQTNEALQAQLQELQTQTADAILSGSPDGSATHTPPAPRSTPRRTVATAPRPEPTRPPATPPEPPTPSGAGICGRTPEVQTTLIKTLSITSCRLITDEELYRVRTLPTIKPPSLRQGDFRGLVSLQSLTIEMHRGDRPAPPKIHSGTFAGLITDRLRISNTTMDDGAFDNARIKYLSIRLAEGGPSYDSNDNITDRRTPGHLPSALPPSLIRLHVTGDLRLLDWRIFQALPKLEYLSLTHDQARSENTPVPSTITIPAEAFSQNTALRGLKLQADSSTYTRAFRLPADLLANHRSLSYIYIYRLIVNRSLPGELPIQIHADSPAGTYVAEQGLRQWNSWENTSDFRITVGDFPSP